MNALVVSELRTTTVCVNPGKTITAYDHSVYKCNNILTQYIHSIYNSNVYSINNVINGQSI